jgi:mannose-6-phosphate isomerase
MPKFDIPLQLAPVFKPKIWGRRDLSPLFDGPGQPALRPPAGAPIGEAWLTDDASRILNGPPAGMTLAGALARFGPELAGESRKEKRFPLLAKYIFTRDWLSVQVHPDDAYARLHDPGSSGKCEMWYIVEAERKAEVLLGAKPGVSSQDFRRACREGASAKLLQRFRPRAGQAMFIPPGTVHALGPGLVLFEVEQNSDLTYRLDDFGRRGLDGKPRPLHLEKGLETARLDLPAHHNLPRVVVREPYGARRYVAACRYFALEELTVRRRASFDSRAEQMEVLSVLEGEGRIETAAGWLAYRRGETWLVPAALERYRLVPLERTRLLKFYLPDLERDLLKPLERRRVKPRVIEKLVFG